MAEQRPLGCGRFSDDAWAALIVGGAGDPLAAPLLEHASACAACRAELGEYVRLTARLRAAAAAPGAHEPVRSAFVDSVLAAAARTDSAPARQHAQRRRLRPSWAAAAAVVLLAIVLGGVPVVRWWLPGPYTASDGSIGRTWPGGTILALSDAAALGSPGLTTRGVTAAATDGAAPDRPAAASLSAFSTPSEPASSPAGVPIRVTAGVATASAAFGAPALPPVAEPEGGLSVP